MPPAFQLEADHPSGAPTLFSKGIAGARVAVSRSTDPEDRFWDEFLQTTPRGQFQQSSLWARCKAIEGWSAVRSVFRIDDRIVGGFQMLWRRTRFGRIGYISKGPVLLSETDELAEFALERICGVATGQKLTALIVQPPDQAQINPSIFPRYRFQPNHVHDVIEATLLVDVTGGRERVEKKLNRNAWREVRQAKARGVVVREGGQEVIDRFFKMMLATCARQNQKPNPSNAKALGVMWEAFRPLGARITIAHCRGEDVAGHLTIPFGDRVTLWKKGWTGQHKELHPNKLLTYESLEWASRMGYKNFDFASLQQDIAVSLLQGRRLTEAQKKSRDMFHLDFGGHPQLLPEARIRISNPILSLAYQFFYAHRETKPTAAVAA